MAVKAKDLHFQVDATISWAAGGWIAHILEANPNGLTDEHGDPLFEFMPRVFVDDEHLLDHLRKSLAAIRKNEVSTTFGEDTDPGERIPFTPPR